LAQAIAAGVLVHDPAADPSQSFWENGLDGAGLWWDAPAGP